MALAVHVSDIDLDAAEIRIRTLKRRREHWRSVPVPAALVHQLDLVHRLQARPSESSRTQCAAVADLTGDLKLNISTECGLLQ